MPSENGFADQVRFILAVSVAVLLLVVGLWDAYCAYRHRLDLTVSAIVRQWCLEMPILTVFAAFLFYHLFVEH